jgi:hypothetical protein
VVPPISVHQYSGISLLSVNNDKLHFFDLGGHTHVDNGLMWLIGVGAAKQELNRDLAAQHQAIKDCDRLCWSLHDHRDWSSTDITYDDWEAFWAPDEHQVCAVDLKALKAYCLDYNAPNPRNKAGQTSAVDYVTITPRDSISGLHYVLLMASTPGMAVFSVDEKFGTLRWELRPEVVAPLMGSNLPGASQNNDGNCDPKEPCFTGMYLTAGTATSIARSFPEPARIHRASESAASESRSDIQARIGSRTTPI